MSSDSAPAGVRAFLAVGSNLGDRLRALQTAVDALQAAGGITVDRCSRIYETAPVGGPDDQGSYLNAVLETHTTLTPHGLLAAAREVEDAGGRVRTERWGPRTIDVDILTFGDVEMNDPPALIVPHPRMHERMFVLAPLLELEADPMLPGGRRAASLRLSASDAFGVAPFAPPLDVGPPPPPAAASAEQA